MTLILSILCSDGVVIGADSAATSAAGQLRTMEQPVDKIELLAEGSVILAATGPVGLGQRFAACIQKAWPQCKKLSALAIGKDFSAAGIKDFAETQAPNGQFGALVAFAAQGTPQVVELGLNDFQPELKNPKIWYASMGSGQLIADPFLALMREVFWQDGPPPLQDGIFAAVWTLEHAIAVNPGGINGPMRIGILERLPGGHLKARLLNENEISEHQQNVSAAKIHLRDFKKSHGAAAAPEIPVPPSGVSVPGEGSAELSAELPTLKILRDGRVPDEKNPVNI